MKVHFNLNMEMSEAAERYVHACARIRHISTTRLMMRVMQTVCDDQLVLSILDDESKQPKRLPGEHTKSHYHKTVHYAGFDPFEGVPWVRQHRE
jgi:hypothetical protein